MRALLSLALAVTFASAFSQTTKAADPPAAGQATAPAKPKSDLKPYEEVTKDYVAQPGVFKVHRSDDKDKILWEIPENLLEFIAVPLDRWKSICAPDLDRNRFFIRDGAQT
ncbi:MAG: DUF5118 domain-containing protein, partial [Fimbriimonadaceae bacterium]